MMQHNGYVGQVTFDDEAGIFHGEVINTRDVITFQGDSVAELRQAFQDSVADYLAFCKQRGESPEKPLSGKFVTRIPPELHRQINEAAALAGKSLNAWVTEQLKMAVYRKETIKMPGKLAKSTRPITKSKGKLKGISRDS